MRKLLAVFFCALSCSRPKTLSEQLTISFQSHLDKIDSTAKIDSVHVLWNRSITEKMGKVIDDTVYRRELNRVQNQLLSAQQKNDKDSINFYHYEINYMGRQIDTLTKSIDQSDTTHPFGNLIGCAYSITRNKKTLADSTLVVIDSAYELRFTDFMDSSLRRTVKLLH